MIRTQLLASAAAGALFVVALEHGIGGDAVAGARTPTTAAPAVTTGRIVSDLPDFSALVAQASPAVVSIRVTKAIATAGAPGPALPPGFEFFRRFAPEGLPRQPDMPVEGAGSGFIISADGHVLTNAHVVDGADEITVRLADKREYQAKVLGIDATTDVAVLKLPARGLPTLRVGDTNALAVGEWVIAIGSPFGFDHTVSAGVVSAKTRSLPNGGYVPFIQTDVALNPGNSGGPLLNLRGEVVGINSQIYSRSGGYMGLSFAIPIDLAMNVQAELVAHGKVSRGRLGVMVQSVDQALAESFGLPRPAGALIGAVEPGLAAARAGLRPGDVITAVNGG
ncbi:MAG: trypsin-like peptidase domain-containing protein, partial [Gammaproteobacteria bacterium]